MHRRRPVGHRARRSRVAPLPARHLHAGRRARVELEAHLHPVGGEARQVGPFEEPRPGRRRLARRQGQRQRQRQPGHRGHRGGGGSLHAQRGSLPRAGLTRYVVEVTFRGSARLPDPTMAAQQPPASPGPVEPGSPEAAAGERLPYRFGKYTLIRRLATGGMAELFLAIQKSVAGFEKLVVIKRILPAMNQDRAFIDMLLHEARVAATLSHPNIVQIFDVGAGRRHLLHRDGARARRGPSLDRPPDEEEGRRRVPARARALHRPRHVRGPRLLARQARSRRDGAQHRAPRRVAAERRRHVHGRRENRRLRHRQERRPGRPRRGAEPQREPQGQGAVHVARAGARRGHRLAQRHLRRRRDAVRADDGQAPLQGHERVRDAEAHLRPRVPAALAGAPGLPARARGHRDARAREGPRGALARARARCRARSRSSCGRSGSR